MKFPLHIPFVEALAFCEASVVDDDNHLCAHATGTFKYLRKLPTKGRGLKAMRTTKESP